MEDFNHLKGEEKLQAENEFIKMKLMLEKGASFETGEGEKLPAEIENQFLQNIIEFDKQFDEHKTIRVFDKIGRPAHFKPAADIPVDKIDNAWKELSAYLSDYGISLDACSPNISTRELYRFTVEELFEHEMDDMNIPGMMHGFIYDEFHPDPVYDNTRAAKDECIRYILEKEPLEWTHHFRKENLHLNGHTSLTTDELKTIVNRFKLAYDNLEVNEIEEKECIVDEKESRVKGIYEVAASAGNETYLLKGNWKVVFEKDDEHGYWYINNVQIEGINF